MNSDVLPVPDAHGGSLDEAARLWYWSPRAFAEAVIPFGKVGTPYQDWVKMHGWIEDALSELDRVLHDRLMAAPPTAGNEAPKVGPIGMLISSGTGSGKSSCLIPVLVAWAMVTRPFSVGVMTAASEDQLRARAWGDTKTLFETNQYLRAKFDSTDKYISRRDYVPNPKPGMAPRWGIIPMCPAPERSERFHGLHSSSCTLAVLEEGEGVPDANHRALIEGIQIDTFPLTVACGNPTRRTGWFSDGVNRVGEFADNWDVHRCIDIRTIENKTQAEIDLINKKIEKAGGIDSDYARAKVLGQVPLTSAQQYIPEPVVRRAVERTKVMLNAGYMRTGTRGGPVQMACDLSRGGDARTVVMFREGYDAGTFPIHAFEGRQLNPTRTVHMLKAMMDRRHPRPGGEAVGAEFAFVDTTGGQGSEVHELHRQGYKHVHGVQMSWQSPDEACDNYRAYCWKCALHWLENGGMLPVNRDGSLSELGEILVRELLLPDYEYTERGARLRIEDKKSIMEKNGGKSPDFADTFTMLCLPAPRRLERQFAMKRMRAGRREQGRIDRARQRRVGRGWRR